MYHPAEVMSANRKAGAAGTNGTDEDADAGFDFDAEVGNAHWVRTAGAASKYVMAKTTTTSASYLGLCAAAAAAVEVARYDARISGHRMGIGFDLHIPHTRPR